MTVEDLKTLEGMLLQFCFEHDAVRTGVAEARASVLRVRRKRERAEQRQEPQA